MIAMQELTYYAIADIATGQVRVTTNDPDEAAELLIAGRTLGRGPTEYAAIQAAKAGAIAARS